MSHVQCVFSIVDVFLSEKMRALLHVKLLLWCFDYEYFIGKLPSCALKRRPKIQLTRIHHSTAAFWTLTHSLVSMLTQPKHAFQLYLSLSQRTKRVVTPNLTKFVGTRVSMSVLKREYDTNSMFCEAVSLVCAIFLSNQNKLRVTEGCELHSSADEVGVSRSSIQNECRFAIAKTLCDSV